MTTMSTGRGGGGGGTGRGGGGGKAGSEANSVGGRGGGGKIVEEDIEEEEEEYDPYAAGSYEEGAEGGKARGEDGGVADFVHDDGWDGNAADAEIESHAPADPSAFEFTTPPALPIAGTAHLDAHDTLLAVLSPDAYGTAFDAWLLDGDGRPLAGPCEFRMVPGSAAEAASILGVGGEGKNNGKGKVDGKGGGEDKTPGLLAYHQDANKMKQHNKKGPGMLGILSAGSKEELDDVEDVILATPGHLTKYVLEVGQPQYGPDETVEIKYNINVDR